jgi:hypothetical protein
MRQTFTTTVNDPNGYSDVWVTYFMIGNPYNGTPRCLVSFVPSLNILYLENDAENAYLGPVTANGGPGLQNSRCIVSSATWTIQGATTMAINVALQFLPGFEGAHDIWAAAGNNGGLSSGWNYEGSWTANYQPPSITSVGPNVGTGATQTFAVGVTDPDGYSDVWVTYLLIGNAYDGTPRCLVSYVPSLNVLYLENDAQNSYLGPIAANGGSSLQNSRCVVSSASMTPSGEHSMTANIALQFLPAFAGTHGIWAAAVDNEGLNSYWTDVGSWTVPSAITLTPSSATMSAAGGPGSFYVQASGCWTATSSGSWITITSGASGCYPNTVAYSVAPNIGGQQTGTIYVTGQTFTIYQAASGQKFLSTGYAPSIFADGRQHNTPYTCNGFFCSALSACTVTTAPMSDQPDGLVTLVAFKASTTDPTSATLTFQATQKAPPGLRGLKCTYTDQNNQQQAAPGNKGPAVLGVTVSQLTFGNTGNIPITKDTGGTLVDIQNTIDHPVWKVGNAAADNDPVA